MPLYVAIERIDKRVLEAAYDLYATRRQAFLRVILPLTVPGIFAAFLLTFIPALGDYVNQQILGGTSNTMIGTVIQNAFLVNLDYAGGSALSAVLMAIALVGIFAYARLLGSRSIEDYLERRPVRPGLPDGANAGGGTVSAGHGAGPPGRRSPRPRRRRRWTRFLLPAYSWLIIAYLVFPIAVMILYSFNKVTTGLPQVSFAWNGFTTQWYQQWKDIPQLTSAFWLSIRLAIVATSCSPRCWAPCWRWPWSATGRPASAAGACWSRSCSSTSPRPRSCSAPHCWACSSPSTWPAAS